MRRTLAALAVVTLWGAPAAAVDDAELAALLGDAGAPGPADSVDDLAAVDDLDEPGQSDGVAWDLAAALGDARETGGAEAGVADADGLGGVAIDPAVDGAQAGVAGRWLGGAPAGEIRWGRWLGLNLALVALLAIALRVIKRGRRSDRGWLGRALRGSPPTGDGGAPEPRLEVLARRCVPHGHSLLLVEADGTRMLVGAWAGGMAPLGTLPAATPATAVDAAPSTLGTAATPASEDHELAYLAAVEATAEEDALDTLSSLSISADDEGSDDGWWAERETQDPDVAVDDPALIDTEDAAAVTTLEMDPAADPAAGTGEVAFPVALAARLAARERENRAHTAAAARRGAAPASPASPRGRDLRRTEPGVIGLFRCDPDPVDAAARPAARHPDHETLADQVLAGVRRARGGLGAIALLATAGAALAWPGDALAAVNGLQDIAGALSQGEGSSWIETALFGLGVLTVLAVAPALLITLTSFTRLIIVFSFLRQALGTQNTPPNQVLIGLSLFLTYFVMAPVFTQMKADALDPYVDGEIGIETALERGAGPLREFMFRQTRIDDLELMVAHHAGPRPSTREEISLAVLVPAFMLSELRTAFEIGFLLYIPFLIVDLLVSTVLLAMGMMVLPPVVISLPFKILLFLLVDGWNLLVGSLLVGFH